MRVQYLSILTISLMSAVSIAAPSIEPDTAKTLVDAQTQYQQGAADSQTQIEKLDDETLALLTEYNAESARLDALNTYNNNLRAMLASQTREKARLTDALGQIEVTRRELVPLMTEMTSVLAQFVGLDKPMLMEERLARVEVLKDNLGRSDVELAEKYRRIIESYQIEAEYGQSIEAYEGEVTVDGRALTVDFLRVGRAALYYISLNRDQAAIWDSRSNDWFSLDPSHLDNLDYALRVARRQAPPDLMPLPLWSTQ